MPDIQPLQIDTIVRSTTNDIPKVTINCSITAQYAADKSNKDTLAFVFHAHPLGANNKDINAALTAMDSFCASLSTIARAHTRLVEEPFEEPPAPE